jgi:hypothetical protein
MTEPAPTPPPEPALLTSPRWPLGTANSPTSWSPTRRVLAWIEHPTTMGNSVLHIGTPTHDGRDSLADTYVLLTPAEREHLIADLIAHRAPLRDRVEAASRARIADTELTPAEAVTATLLTTWPLAVRTTLVLYAQGLVARATPVVHEVEQWPAVAAALGMPREQDVLVDGARVTLDDGAWRMGIGAVHALGHGRVERAREVVEDDPFDVFRPWWARCAWTVRPEHLVLPGGAVDFADYVDAVTTDTASVAVTIVRAAHSCTPVAWR